MNTDGRNTADPRVTMAMRTVHNPNEPRHFMKLKPVSHLVRILRDGVVLAQSGRALRLIEAGRDLYDPALYFSPEDTCAVLVPSKTQSHCPLKGDARYFDLAPADPALPVPDIAWSYPDPFDFADDLRGLIAFYPSKVTTEEHPR